MSVLYSERGVGKLNKRFHKNMPRHHQERPNALAEARIAVRQLAGSPLEQIAQGLTNALDLASEARSTDAITEAELARIGEYVTTIIGFLPKAYGDRFWFDAGLIRAMSSDWSEEELFSTMILPCYGSQWGTYDFRCH